jgi:hypothetical protein
MDAFKHQHNSSTSKMQYDCECILTPSPGVDFFSAAEGCVRRELLPRPWRGPFLGSRVTAGYAELYDIRQLTEVQSIRRQWTPPRQQDCIKMMRRQAY